MDTRSPRLAKDYADTCGDDIAHDMVLLVQESLSDENLTGCKDCNSTGNNINPTMSDILIAIMIEAGARTTDPSKCRTCLGSGVVNDVELWDKITEIVKDRFFPYKYEEEND